MNDAGTHEDRRGASVDESAGRWVSGPYRRLCAAVAVSETGDWLLFMALPLYVLGVSGSALDTSTVFLAELIPAVVISIVCAPLIDRWNPGRLLATLTGLQALVVLPLLWVGHGSLWLIYAVAAAQAAFTSLTTPAQQAVVPRLVDSSHVLRANAIVEMASNGARLLGSPLGGVLLPIVGLRGLVIADAMTFLVNAALLIRPRSGASRSQRPATAERTPNDSRAELNPRRTVMRTVAHHREQPNTRGRTRTCDPRLRRPSLYPAELRGHAL